MRHAQSDSRAGARACSPLPLLWKRAASQPQGWAGPIYRAGLVLLDLDDPSKVIKRGDTPILSPREDYERIGDIGNVCFACGAVVDDDGNMKIYYGAADTSICIATCTLDQLLEEGF